MTHRADPSALAATNTDRELWREVPDDYYSPAIHVTAQGNIGINVGGRVYVMSLRKWHGLAAALREQSEQMQGNFSDRDWFHQLLDECCVLLGGITVTFRDVPVKIAELQVELVRLKQVLADAQDVIHGEFCWFTYHHPDCIKFRDALPAAPAQAESVSGQAGCVKCTWLDEDTLYKKCSECAAVQSVSATPTQQPQSVSAQIDEMFGRRVEHTSDCTCDRCQREAAKKRSK